MLLRLSRRLLTLLQLTRMALVFTAIADGVCTLLLSARRNIAPDASLLRHVDPQELLAVAAVSVGLYGFGMSLNDIIDRRRDQKLAPARPLPSGRIGVGAAHVVCVGLGLLAVTAGVYYSTLPDRDWMSLILVIWTGLLISFYDLAGKYLVAPGLLTLGLIRFFQALVADPAVPLIWHPLLLLNHITILSAVAYVWEEKRPALTKIHWWIVLGGLGMVDLLAVSMVAERRSWAGAASASLEVQPGLIVPALAALAFVMIAWSVRRSSETSREAGQKLMLYGLLWLIVYDASFAAGYTHDWIATVGILCLLPLAYFSVQLMRWWSKLISLSQRPTFKRAKA